MRGTVKLGNKNVEMDANAFTPVLFRKVFKKDFIKESQKEDVDITIFQELGFIMASQAKELSIKELTELTVESYYEWLMEYEALDIMQAVNDIFSLYSAQTKTTSRSKKNP